MGWMVRGSYPCGDENYRTHPDRHLETNRDTRPLSREERGRVVALTIHHYLAPRLKKE
jgi:hypothetical protein